MSGFLYFCIFCHCIIPRICNYGAFSIKTVLSLNGIPPFIWTHDEFLLFKFPVLSINSVGINIGG